MNVNDFAGKQARQLVQIPDEFLTGVERAQQEIYNRILELYSTLERDGDGIVMSDSNLEIAEEIKNSLAGIFNDSKYYDAVEKFAESFDKQKALIDDYLVATFGESIKSEFADEVFEMTKAAAVETLASSTVTTNFLRPLQQQIDLAVQTGQSFRETVKQLRTYATGGKVDPGVPLAGKQVPGGKLLQYSKQIAYDSIAMSDRAYTNAVASDTLESEWYFYAGGVLPTSRQFCLDRVGKYFHYKEIEDWADLEWQGKPENLTKENIFVLLGGYNCQHTLIPVSIDQVPSQDIQRAIEKGYYDPTKQEQKIIEQKQENEPGPDELTDDEQKEFESFERDTTLTGDSAKVQDDSIKYYIKNKDNLVVQYLKDNGNIANTDEARKLFDVVGYNGKNASAVHEAASALNKLVQQRLIDTGKMNHIVMYAGGAGSGKTSAIEGLFKSVKNSADVIIDGNMAGKAKAMKLLDSILAKGKTAEIMYVYRDPVDAWTNGVIKRMLENEAERGRVVPLRTFMENTVGSYETIKGLLELDKYKQVNINLIDNSLGRGNTQLMDLAKFKSIDYNPQYLKDQLIDETRRLVDIGRITPEQFEALTETKYVAKNVYTDYDLAVRATQKALNTIDDLEVRQSIGFDYSIWVNEAIRDASKMTDKINTAIQRIDYSIEQLPVFHGTSYRGISFDSLDDYRKFVNVEIGGDMFFDKAYLSTSRLSGIADGDYSTRAYKIFFEINGLSGRAISGFADKPYQEEILFPRNTKFRILSKTETIENGIPSMKVVIEEIP